MKAAGPDLKRNDPTLHPSKILDREEWICTELIERNWGIFTSILQCATVWLTIFCALVNDNTVVVMIKFFALLHVIHVQNRFDNALLCC